MNRILNCAAQLFYHKISIFAIDFGISVLKNKESPNIFGRKDKPQGKLYEYQPKVIIEDERMQDFIEMCFDPNFPANAKLKQALLKLMEE